MVDKLADYPRKDLRNFCRQRRPQFVVAGGHNISELQGSLFAAGARHSCLWPKATRFYESDDPAKPGTSSHTNLNICGDLRPRNGSPTTQGCCGL